MSDQYGAIYRAGGLDIAQLRSHVADSGTVLGYPEAEEMEPSLLLALDVDLLVPAAVEGVLHAENASSVRARAVVEGANGPTTTAADRILAEAGVLVVPDILANAGGVLVSYFEWVQGNQAYWWSASEVDQKLESRMTSAWDSLLAASQRRGLSLRQTATITAVERVAEAHLIRGLYP